MLKITISNLYPIRDRELLNELTAEEMKTVIGGLIRRPLRRGETDPDTVTVNTQDLSSVLASLDSQIRQMTISLNEQSTNLQKQLGF